MILFRIFELFPQYLWYFVNILLTSIFELFPLSERCLLFSLLSTSLFCRFLNCILGHIMINEWSPNHIFLDNISPVMEVRHGVESSTGRDFFQQFSLEMGVFKMGHKLILRIMYHKENFMIEKWVITIEKIVGHSDLSSFRLLVTIKKSCQYLTILAP